MKAENRKSKIPSNIDFLNAGNPCNQNCKQCFYKNENNLAGVSNDEEMILMREVANNYKGSSIFIYPKEITTSSYIIPLMGEFKQKSTLSNGLKLNDEIIKNLKKEGVNQIGITLFATFEEQRYFNNNTEKEYNQIKQNIKRAIDGGLEVKVNNVLDKETSKSIGLLCDECFKLGVKKIEFLRLRPVGNGATIDKSRLLTENDMEAIIFVTENMKRNYSKDKLYLSFSLSFGPNFYGKSLKEAKEKIKKSNQKSWMKSNFLCPAINQNYYGISLKSGNVYWCFFLISEPEISKIGTINIDKKRVYTDTNIDLSGDTLKKKLRGNCSLNNCKYQSLCLGGCRSIAYTFAKLKEEPEPLYAGMDICLTKSYEKFYNTYKNYLKT